MAAMQGTYAADAREISEQDCVSEVGKKLQFCVSVIDRLICCTNGGDTQSRNLHKFLASNFRASLCKFG